MKQDDALILVLQRNAFYRRMHYLALAAFVLGLMVLGLLFWSVYYLSHNPRPPLYFVTDKVGRLIEPVPVSSADIMPEKDVISWTVEAVESAFSYDFVNYRRQLQGAQKYFTNYGWREYMKAFTASNNLVAIKQRRMTVSAKVVDVRPETKGILSGAYAWKYRMKLLVTYKVPPYTRQSSYTNPLEVAVIVQRQPELQSYKGLGIVQAVGRFAVAPSRKTESISATPGR